MESNASFRLTSDSLSCVVLFVRAVRSALEDECNTSLTCYRVLSHLANSAEGLTPGQLAAATRLTPGSITMALDRLSGDGLLKEAGKLKDARSYLALISEKGRQRLQECDEAFLAAFNAFFEPLTADRMAELLSGSLVTSSFFDETRFEENRYFFQYSVLIGILLSEQFFTKATHAYDLGLGEYRVLMLLSEHPHANRPKHMRELLLAHPSELSNWCKSLVSKGLLAKAPSPGDKRGFIYELTADGEKTVEAVSTYVNAISERPIIASEVAIFNEMFRLLMDNARKAGGFGRG